MVFQNEVTAESYGGRPFLLLGRTRIVGPTGMNVETHAGKSRTSESCYRAQS